MRPTHYCAHGSGGLYFACYHKELVAHIESKRQVRQPETGWMIDQYDIKAPKRHTDLRRVNCRDCWTEIRRRANKALGQ